MTDDELNGLFRRLSESVPNASEERLEGRLRAAFRAGRPRHNRFLEFVLKVAASVAAAVALYFLVTHGRGTHRESASARPVYKSSDFVVLPYGQSDVPLEQPVIVRVQVPASELSGLGVPLPSLRGESRVEADLLVGQDGIARAVRVNRQIEP